MRALALVLLTGCSGSSLSSRLTDADGDAVGQIPECQESAFLADTLDVYAGACHGTVHAFAGAGGSTLAFSTEGLATPGIISVETLSGDVLGWDLTADGTSFEVELPWSGEFFLRVDVDEPTELTLSRECVAGCERGYTRYPIFLLHGMAGTDTFVGAVDYFNGVKDTLEADGYTIGVGAVDPFQITPGRAVQWASHLDAFFADGRHRKVNLVGHSQGGMDARYLTAHLDPDQRVASVLTIGTPHRGTAVAAVGAGLLQHSGITEAMVEAAIGGLASFYDVESDEAIVEQIQGLAPDAMEEFNTLVPDRADVYYASWGGKSCQLLDFFCLWQNDGEVITAPLAATHLLLKVLEGDNDGLVSVESARWGVDYGALPADHADQIGLLNVFDFDHLAFYEEEAAWLRELGL
ncbi:MAG: triacylglycerol lipase [Alphaproteobacteria bacterium]|nr:triacylglycerol lipase [Alphaproteobacteria bacterium]MCB9691266.1 triacylglycerol lipase [Alphaproteobacteria bacterium]